MRRNTKPAMGNLYADEEQAARLAKQLHRGAPSTMGVHTGQESAALFRAAGEGPTLRPDYSGNTNFQVDYQGGTLTWQAPRLANLPHKVVLCAREDENIDVLLELCREQDTDTAYLATYLTNLLKPNGLNSTIDLYRTAQAIGLRVDKMGEKDKLTELRRVWRGLRWLSAATVVILSISFGPF